ncbi:hypothetical protein LSCM1_06711 [Leishmania martiniquensis]|uniref:Uncharacterized protein n=1 Tax=Leishmania martiniquensis TaxID=1580590 RepID=A0A836HBF8_9TRYP|nr:hypothetical protein LSCM1_06711 [Leishmania martiniquensis]
MQRRAEHHSAVVHGEGHPHTRLSETARGEASSSTRLSQQAHQLRHGTDYRCRGVGNCSLRDLQEGLYARLQRRLHYLAASPSGSASTPLLVVDATVRLWRDTRLALRQQMRHRSGIHAAQRRALLRGQLLNEEKSEEGVVMDGAVRRILAEREASRTYLLAGAASGDRAESTRWH